MPTYTLKKERECKGSVRYIPIGSTSTDPFRVIYIDRAWLMEYGKGQSHPPSR